MKPLTVGHSRKNTNKQQWWHIPAGMITAAGVFILIIFLLATTPLPRHWHAWFIGQDRAPKDAQEILVVLNDTIGSEPSLMCGYITARSADQWPNAIIFVATSTTRKENSDPGTTIHKELVLRGVNTSRVRPETRGNSIHEHAQNIARQVGDTGLDLRVGIISADHRLRRMLLTFEKAGFANVSAITMETNSANLRTEQQNSTEDARPWVKDNGGKHSFGHQFFTNLHHEINIIREIFAHAYYKLRGWM